MSNSAYFYNNHSIVAPPGTVCPYLGGGLTQGGINNSDPDGWVICDGLPRTCSDSRYANLATILNTYFTVSNNTANQITPPNLTSSFIYGQTSASTNTYSSSGASTVTLTIENMPPHSHGYTDTGHNHISVDNGLNGTTPENLDRNVIGAGGGNSVNVWGNIAPNSGYEGLTSNEVTGISINNTGGLNNVTQSFSIMPPYVCMNYIIKY